MSKPLELTIYPPLSPLVQRGVEINIEQGCYPYLGFSAEMHVPGIVRMHTKRLTDAELAAESYRQMARAVAVSGAVMLHNNEFVPADVVAGGPLTEDTQRLGVMKRFATHPHYFEATEPESDTE